MGSIPRANTPPPVIDKTLSVEGAVAESKSVGDKINKINNIINNLPILVSRDKNIDLSSILEFRKIFLIFSLNGGSASKAVGNIGILADAWGYWTLTNFNKIALEGDSTGYMSFDNNNKILTVPQSYGFSYTVIFKL